MFKYILTVFLCFCSAYASDLDDVTKAIFSGKKFNLEEAESILNNPDFLEDHRILIAVQMLSSVDDSVRYEKALSIISNNKNKISKDWVGDFLRFQEAYLHNLLGGDQSDVGAAIMEDILEKAPDSLIFFDEEDAYLNLLKKNDPNISYNMYNALRVILGHYYLLRVSDETDDDNIKKSLVHFLHIISPEKRRRSLDQWEIQSSKNIQEFMRGDTDLTKIETFKLSDFVKPRKSKAVLNGEERKSKNLDTAPNDLKTENNETSNTILFVGGLIAFFLGVFLYYKYKKT